MIVKTFDYGWGSELVIPKMIRADMQKIKDNYSGTEPTIFVNSTWYTDEVNAEVRKFIKDENIKKIILVSLADAYIPHKGFYEDLDVECFGIGYYPGEGFYDFWAGAFHKLHTRVPDELLLDPCSIEKPFMCLNRKHHEHRVRIVEDLRSAELTDKGIVTLGGTDLFIENDVPDHVSVNLELVPVSQVEGRLPILINIYNSIKDDSWPDCVSYEDFKKLPSHIIDECRDVYEFDILSMARTAIDDIFKEDYSDVTEEDYALAKKLGIKLVKSVNRPMVANDVVTLGRTDIWCSHFLNMVTETWWDINRVYFVSEKIYKPIVGLRPFFIWCEDMGVKWLSDRKFELYHRDFQDITDLDLTNHENMIPFLKTLSQQPKTYLENKFVDLKEKILYNRNRFDEYVQEQDLDAVIERMNQFLG